MNPILSKAAEIAAKEVGYPMTEEDRKAWKWAETALISSGHCPHCACDGDLVKLGKWEPGDHENYAGRYCPQCEEFTVCGPQGNYDPPEYDVDAAGMCYSDADPGL